MIKNLRCSRLVNFVRCIYGFLFKGLRAHIVFVPIIVCLCGCLGPDRNGKGPIDYFSGTWKAILPGGEIQMTYIDGGKFETKWIAYISGVDSLVSHVVYRYRVMEDSSLIEETIDSVIKHPVPLANGTRWYLYYKPIGDTLLVGLSQPILLDWASTGENLKDQLLHTWTEIKSGSVLSINIDSTGTLGGKAGVFRISRDLLIFEDLSEPYGGQAYYYKVTGNKMRTWLAKYDCSEAGCAVDEKNYFHKIK